MQYTPAMWASYNGTLVAMIEALYRYQIGPYEHLRTRRDR